MKVVTRGARRASACFGKRIRSSSGGATDRRSEAQLSHTRTMPRLFRNPESPAARSGRAKRATLRRSVWVRHDAGRTASRGRPIRRAVALLPLVLFVLSAEALGQAGVSITQTGGSTDVNEAGATSDTYTLVLDTLPTADVSVIATPDSQTDLGAGAGVGLLLTFTTANWNVTQTITVQAVDENVHPLVVNSVHFTDELIAVVERDDRRYLDRLKRPVVEVGLELCECRNHVAIARNKTDPPSGHRMTLGEGVQLHTNLFCPRHLEETRWFIPVEGNVGVSEIVDVGLCGKEITMTRGLGQVSAKARSTPAKKSLP